MSRSIYFINPLSDFPSYFGGEVFAGRGFRPGLQAADLTLPTLAAMTPTDLNVRLCDENLTPIDFDCEVDYVGITGKISQIGRMVAIAGEFRRRGKIVLIGGPCASLAPERLRPHCDILVRGEIEDIYEDLFADLRESTWKGEYVGGRPDLDRSPRPNWDLYPNNRAMAGTIQTSRGCPFQCEFCDVIQYLGRKQRHKPISRVLDELENLYRLGYRSVLLSDDNLTASRPRAKELLAALRDWNRRRDRGKVIFATQLSIDASEDDELLRLCAEAGLNYVYIGIETANEDSLREAHKHQNLRGNLVEQVERFFEYGIGVMGGMIVGFDSDDQSIFQRQFEFGMSTRIPILSVGALVAPEATPLRARMAKEGRLLPDGPEVAAFPWNTNIRPRQMTLDQLISGVQWLCNALYHPTAFEERLLGMIKVLGRRRRAEIGVPLSGRTIERDAMSIVAQLKHAGPDEMKMLARVVPRALLKPQVAALAGLALLQYQQVRYMYEQERYWDPGAFVGQPLESNLRSSFAEQPW